MPDLQSLIDQKIERIHQINIEQKSISGRKTIKESHDHSIFLASEKQELLEELKDLLN